MAGAAQGGSHDADGHAASAAAAAPGTDAAQLPGSVGGGAVVGAPHSILTQLVASKLGALREELPCAAGACGMVQCLLRKMPQLFIRDPYLIAERWAFYDGLASTQPRWVWLGGVGCLGEGGGGGRTRGKHRVWGRKPGSRRWPSQLCNQSRECVSIPCRQRAASELSAHPPRTHQLHHAPSHSHEQQPNTLTCTTTTPPSTHAVAVGRSVLAHLHKLAVSGVLNFLFASNANWVRFLERVKYVTALGELVRRGAAPVEGTA